MNINTFRAVGIGAVSLSAMLLAACGGSDAGGGGTAKPVQWSAACDETCQAALSLKADATKVDCTVGISQNALDNPYAVAQKAGLEKAAKRSFPNMKILTADGQHDAVTQSSQVRDFVTRGVDALVITPLEEDSLAPAVKAAMDAGVEVIAHDRAVNTKTTTAITANNVEAGEEAATEMVDDLGPEGGNVVEIQGSAGASAAIDRHKGMENVLADHPEVKVVAEQVGDWARGNALTAMRDVLQRFGKGKIDAVFAHNDEMALGVQQAVSDAGRADEIAIYSFDGQESAFQAIKDGKIASTVIYPLDAPEAIAAAAKTCAGEKLPKEIKLSSTLVNSENIDKFLGKGF